MRTDLFELLDAMAARGKARRRELGLEVGDLARRLGTSTGRAHNLESVGASTLRLAARWAEALEMPLDELVFGSRAAR